LAGVTEVEVDVTEAAIFSLARVAGVAKTGVAETDSTTSEDFRLSDIGGLLGIISKSDSESDEDDDEDDDDDDATELITFLTGRLFLEEETGVLSVEWKSSSEEASFLLFGCVFVGVGFIHFFSLISVSNFFKIAFFSFSFNAPPSSTRLSNNTILSVS